MANDLLNKLPSSGTSNNDRICSGARKLGAVIVGRPAAKLLDVCAINFRPLSSDESFDP